MLSLEQESAEPLVIDCLRWNAADSDMPSVVSQPHCTLWYSMVPYCTACNPGRFVPLVLAPRQYGRGDGTDRTNTMPWASGTQACVLVDKRFDLTRKRMCLASVLARMET